MLALLLCLAAQESARWALDGDLPPGGKAVGRVGFIDSPIGGRMLALNGVDASVAVDPAPAAGAGDFSVGVWVFPLEMRTSGLVSRTDGKSGWSLDLLADGALRLETSAGTLQTPAKLAHAGQWSHVVASVRRGKVSTIFVNADPAATGEVRADPPAVALTLGRRDGDAKPFCGLMDDVRVMPSALDAEEVARLTDEGLPWLRKKPHARTPFPGRFELLDGDAVVFAGGEDVLSAQESPYLEALLALHAPKHRTFYRSLAWEGDTVHEQWRILNFGPWERQFDRTGASVIFAAFGQMEALQGKDALPEFEAAYGRLLDEFSKRTKRIVLLSPHAFERSDPPRADLTPRNGDVRLYAEAIKALAAKRGLLFVDLFRPESKGLTRDGVHLTAEGHRFVARETARQLGLRVDDSPDALREILAKKNRIWIEHWRPTNWAFLNGDRMEQPSSRDHVDRRVRWFPFEVQQAQALIRADERRAAELLK